jgi:hypothetical protein
MEKASPSSSSDSPTSSEQKDLAGDATRRPTDPSNGSSASGTVTVPTRQAVASKLFKKCKSATFQIDGATYTIGKSLRIAQIKCQIPRTNNVFRI